MAQLSLLYGGVFASALLLGGCAVDVQNQNRQAAQELARLAKPPGSVYTGWRVFQDKCAGCHGPGATGTAPDLLARVRDMGPRRFVSLVLTRYDWPVSTAQASRNSSTLDALVDKIVQREDDVLTMPAWQDEPRVNAHIVDVYAYLSARANGTQGPGRPAP